MVIAWMVELCGLIDIPDTSIVPESLWAWPASRLRGPGERDEGGW
jgi:hypothetical protein